MAVHISWDEYETALLIDACCKYNQNKVSRMEAISYVSKTLRKRALGRGIKIDDVFRNENGISMQFTIMNALLLHQKSGLHNASKLFKDIAAMYEEDRDSFEKILQKARTTETLDAETFHRWLVANGMGEQSSSNYSYAIYSVENYAREQGYEDWHLYGRDFSEAEAIAVRLFSDDDFMTFNEKEHNFFSIALTKYMQYLSGEDWQPVLESHQRAVKAPKVDGGLENQEILAPYNVILLERFPKGYRIDSNLDMKRFLRYYEETYGIYQDASDEAVKQTTRERILQAGVCYDDYVFAIDSLVDAETKTEIIRYIEYNFAAGVRALYYRALFTEFNEVLLNQRIYDEDMLRTYLIHVLDGKYSFSRSYMSQVSGVQIDPVEEVRNILIEHVAPMKTENICNALPHLPKERVEYELGTNKEFIRNEIGKYFHVSVIDLTDDELDNIVRIIKESIEVRHFISGNELIYSINRKYPHLLERFSQFSMMGIRDAIAFYLSARFSFNGNVISALDKNMSMADVFADFARNHASFTIDELNVLKNELNCSIYFDAVYDNSLRVTQQLFVSREEANFDVEKTDVAIGRFCIGNYIALKEVTSFGSLPYAGFSWNIYLLEHYVASFSREYKLLHTKFNADNCVGAIVKRNSGINEFNDLLVDVLAHSSISLTPEDALQYLYDMGLLARRRLSNIDQLLTKARVQKG